MLTEGAKVWICECSQDTISVTTQRWKKHSLCLQCCYHLAMIAREPHSSGIMKGCNSLLQEKKSPWFRLQTAHRLIVWKMRTEEVKERKYSLVCLTFTEIDGRSIFCSLAVWVQYNCTYQNQQLYLSESRLAQCSFGDRHFLTAEDSVLLWPLFHTRNLKHTHKKGR